MRCSNDLIKLGCFNSCDPISTNLKSDIGGLWTIELDYMNITKIIKLNLEVGKEIIVNEKFNENYTYRLRIYKPNGELLGNYSFKTFKSCF